MNLHQFKMRLIVSVSFAFVASAAFSQPMSNLISVASLGPPRPVTMCQPPNKTSVPPISKASFLTTPSISNTAPDARVTAAPPKAPASQNSGWTNIRPDLAPPRLPVVALTNAKPIAAAKEHPADSSADLVGTWRAIARGRDGELTTVDLLFDKGGWATLTISDTNDPGSNVRRRVAVEGDQLKLGDASGKSLGSLVEVTDRQMVIERDGGTITFVRPWN